MTTIKRFQIVAAVVLLLLSVWAAWPMLTLQHYPHAKPRDYVALWLVLVALAQAGGTVGGEKI